MLASQYIKLIQELIDAHGDLPVISYRDAWDEREGDYQIRVAAAIPTFDDSTDSVLEEDEVPAGKYISVGR